jgi:hypothetical protein
MGRAGKKTPKPWSDHTLSWRPGQYIRWKEAQELPVPQRTEAGLSLALKAVRKAGAQRQDRFRIVPVAFDVDQAPAKGHPPQPKFSHTRHGSRTAPADEESLDGTDQAPTQPGNAALAPLPGPRNALVPTLLDSVGPDLDRDDRSTLWNYFHFAPTGAYGTNGHGPFCAFRDVSIPSCHLYPQGILTWMLIAAERHMAIGKQLPESTSLLKRKAKAYRDIGQLLADPKTRISDETLVVIIAAIVIEARFLAEGVTRMHVQGLETLIEQRGGLCTLFGRVAAMGRPLFYISYLTTVPLDREDAVADTRSAQDHSFWREVAVLRRWNKELESLACKVSQGTGVHGKAALERYLDRRRRVLGCAVLRHFSTSPPSVADDDSTKETYQVQASRFISLYLLALILYRLNMELPKPYVEDGTSQNSLESASDGFLRATFFLDFLMHSLYTSGDVDADTGKSSIRIEVLPWVIGQAWASTQSTDSFPTSSTSTWKEEEISVTESCIRAIKAWSGSPGEVRRHLLQDLKWWMSWAGHMNIT